jgi:hypothetical protein
MPCKLGDSTALGKSYLASFDLVTGTAKGTLKQPREMGFTNLIDLDGGVSEVEDLVYAGNEDSPHETDGPSTEGRRWHLGIICVGNSSTDFWIWGLILKHRCRGVKIRVVVVDSNVLSVPNQVQYFSYFLLSNPAGMK